MHRQLDAKAIGNPWEKTNKQQHHKSTLDDNVYLCIHIVLPGAQRAHLLLHIVRTFNAEFIFTRVCFRPLVDSLNQLQNTQFTAELDAYFPFYCILYSIRSPKWKFNFESVDRVHLAFGRSGAQCAKRYNIRMGNK